MQAELLRNAITSQRFSALDVIVDAIRHSGALERTRARAQMHAHAAHEALASLPPSRYRDALAGLADYAVNRDR
jgi:octaprenyl-diphosphate synthase